MNPVRSERRSDREHPLERSEPDCGNSILNGPESSLLNASNGVKIPVLISASRIKSKVKELAGRISRDYRGKQPLMICILNGAFVFMADLLRNLTIPVECDFIRLSSYGNDTKSSGRIRVVMDIECLVSAKGGSASGGKGKDIIIVDDIIDTGLTTGFLVDRLRRAKARSVKICALLDKPSRRQAPIKIDYPGFTVPNKFVVGYGIDYKEQYRQLDYIGYIK
ncbi:MAG: hypoxanthine phosphoribosyltransferase [Planctomycetota bacterium]